MCGPVRPAFGRLGQPLRRPSRWGAQKTFHVFGTQDHQDRIHQRGLPDTRASRDHNHPIGEGRLQRLALARRKRHARSILAPRDCLLKVNRRIERLPLRETLDLRRDPLFRLSEVGQEDQQLTLNLFQQ